MFNWSVALQVLVVHVAHVSALMGDLTIIVIWEIATIA